MEYVYLGKIVNTHGVKGEVKIESHTDFYSERFKKGSTVYLGDDYTALTVKSARMHKGFILALFENYEDINLVLKFKGLNLYKASDDIEPLKDGYYFKDLKGLDVYLADDKVGKVLYVEEGIRNNYLRVEVNNEQKLIPFIDTFIKNVDLDTKRIDIVEMEGLL